ncbi:MAG: glycosyltransferase family 4 protein [Burkholderiales bacterium]|nr:glycosyltransferase family 4 protein [Burkholderiales bacterium]
MKVFGSIDSFVETGETSLKLGRLVANFEFLKALLTYGSFDQYQIYCPTFDNLKLLKHRLEGVVDDRVLSRVILSHHLNFPDALRDTDFSAFHVGGWNWYLPRLAYLRVKYQASFPLTGIIHSLDPSEVILDVRELMRSPLAGCDSIVCTSASGRQVFQNYVEAAHAQDTALSLPARLDLIPLGVGDECFRPGDRAAARVQLGLESSAVLLLYIGRISISTKADLAPLLYTFHRLCAEEGAVNRVYLILAGGADKENVQNLKLVIDELGLGERVLLKPNIADADKFDLYAAADIFVSPIDNFQETFGISVVEAMASGLPTVVSDFDGYRDLVEEGVTGYRIPTTWLKAPEDIADIRGILEPALSSFYAAQSIALDQEALFERLQSLIADGALRKRMGDTGRALAERRFHWRTIIHQYEQLWGTLKNLALETPITQAGTDLNLPDMARVFEHYPSQILTDTTVLALSELGHDVLQGKVLMPATYEELAPLLPGALLTCLLSRLMGNHASLSDIIQTGQSAFGAAPPVTRLCVIWLMKYGLLKTMPG